MAALAISSVAPGLACLYACIIVSLYLESNKVPLAPPISPLRPNLSKTDIVTPAATAKLALLSSPSISFQFCPAYTETGASILAPTLDNAATPVALAKDVPPVTGANAAPPIVTPI